SPSTCSPWGRRGGPGSSPRIVPRRSGHDGPVHRRGSRSGGAGADAMSRRRTDDLRQTGLYPPPGQGSDADVGRLVALGRKIDAIKLHREIHGSDLKTAKDAVDRMTAKPGAGRTP